MKELDVLLERFVHRALDQLDDGELEALEHLLEQPDQDILEWIASPTPASPPAMHGIVALIRSAAHGRPELIDGRYTRADSPLHRTER